MTQFDAIAIVGPTATGKTFLAKELAKKINSELISADSRQVYKYLDIGTNKEGIYNEETKTRIIDGIHQHLTDIIEPDEVFSAGEFVEKATLLMKNLKQNKKIPIIVGGTGLYIKSLVDGIAPLPKKNQEIREKLQKRKEKLYEELRKVDPISAERIHPNNIQRIIRALEVYYLTGMPISYWQKISTKPQFKIIQFAIALPKEKILQNIIKRTDSMIENGLIQETEKVLNMGYSENSPAFQSIGYKSTIKYLKNEIGYEELKKEIIMETKKYLKRQITWFKQDKRIIWLNPENPLKQIFSTLSTQLE